MTLYYRFLKVCLLIAFQFSTQFTFGQIEPTDVQGCYNKRYELNLDTLASFVDVTLCFNEKSDFALTVSIDEKAHHYFGTYKIASDTLVLDSDPIFYEFQVGTRASTRIKKNLTRFTVPSASNSLYGIFLYIIAPDSTITSLSISDFQYSEKNSTYSNEVEIPSGSTLQLIDISRKENLYEYKLPIEANDIHIFINIENVFTEKLYALKNDAGIMIAEQKYKLQTADTLRYLPFDVSMFDYKSESKIPKEYTFLRPFNIQRPEAIIENTEVDTSDYNYYNYEDYYSTQNDTLIYSADYALAKKMAFDSARYLIMYIEPDPCTSCASFTLSKSLKILHDPYSYSQIAPLHAEKSIFYFAPIQDSIRFKQYGIKEFPATVVLSDNGKLLYTEQGEDLHFLKTAYNSYSNGDFYAKLEIHKTFTYLPEIIRSSNYDSTHIFSYLNNLWLSGLYQDGVDDYYPWFEDYDDTKEPDDNAYLEPSDDIDTTYSDQSFEYIEPAENISRSSLKLTVDTLFTYSLLDTLVTRYSSSLLNDSISINKLIRYFYQLNDQYHPYILSETGDKFITRKAFEFLLDHYLELKNKTFFISEYTDPISLYEIISKRINYPINLGLTEHIPEALQYQMLVVKKIPTLEPFEMPLHISHLVLLYDSLQHSTLEEDYIIRYLNTIGGDPEKALAIVDSIQQNLTETNSQATIHFDYAYNYYYWLGGGYRHHNDELPEDIYFRYKNAEVLNSVAWHYYKHITDISKLNLALRWSKSSLSLEPHNPYFLDTYAHLLYKTGNRKEALKYQKRSISEMNSKTLSYEIDYTQRDNIEADYLRMKKKTL